MRLRPNRQRFGERGRGRCRLPGIERGFATRHRGVVQGDAPRPQRNQFRHRPLIVLKCRLVALLQEQLVGRHGAIHGDAEFRLAPSGDAHVFLQRGLQLDKLRQGLAGRLFGPFKLQLPKGRRDFGSRRRPPGCACLARRGIREARRLHLPRQSEDDPTKRRHQRHRTDRQHASARRRQAKAPLALAAPGQGRRGRFDRLWLQDSLLG